LAAVAVGLLVSTLIGSPVGLMAWIVWAVLVGGAGLAAGIVVERATRRYAPLALLVRLSMIFPDQAPSRFRMALRASSTKRLHDSLPRLWLVVGPASLIAQIPVLGVALRGALGAEVPALAAAGTGALGSLGALVVGALLATGPVTATAAIRAPSSPTGANPATAGPQTVPAAALPSGAPTPGILVGALVSSTQHVAQQVVQAVDGALPNGIAAVVPPIPR